MPDPPLLRRYPALGSLPRVGLGRFPTPVQRVQLEGTELLVKRDDRSGGDVLGGNKIRNLEWLLGGVAPGDRVVTVGPRGSSHALATSIHATRLGAAVTVARWNQEMNVAARAIASRLEQAARVVDVAVVPLAYAVAAWERMRGARWIPAGGASALGILGQVNAALELADQVTAGECEAPAVVVVPFGTGGTAAGLALGLRIAGLAARVLAVRVVPKVMGRGARAVSLANDTAALIERTTGEPVPRLRRHDIAVDDAFYAGAYGRPLIPRPAAEPALAALGIELDDTYSRKAFAAAAQPGRRTLFWLTFDARVLAPRT